jgi:hypothetical protein
MEEQTQALAQMVAGFVLDDGGQTPPAPVRQAAPRPAPSPKAARPAPRRAAAQADDEWKEF